MKKIINRRMYNTETAKEIAEFSSGYHCGDFRRYDEALYRTKKGSYFLAGSGGPMTKYSERCGDAWGHGSDLEPISRTQAIEWLEEHGYTDILESEFSDQIEEA